MPTSSTTADRVALFAVCDDAGVPWEGMSFRPPGNYFECVSPRHETRLACVERVYQRRKAEADETAGAVSDRITAEVIAGGVVLPPSTFDAEPAFIDFQF